MVAKTEFEKKKERHASGESTMSADSVSGYIPTPPDGGYGWVIVATAFFIHIIVDGIAFSFGVFYIEFLTYFGESRGKTALVGSLLAGFYLLIAPFASALVNKFGARSVSISGGLVASLAFLLSTFSPNIEFLMITYGVLGGSGLGLAYLPCIVSVSFYFQKRRAVATGIAVCGAGVGCFIFAPAGRLLLDTFDWKNAMLIMSGVVLNLCVAGAMMRPLEPAHKKKKPRAKNVLDRLMEQAKKGMGRQRNESECSACAYQVKDRVQEVKLAREKALRDEDSESEYTSSMPNSVINSVRKLDRSDSYTPSRANSIIINRMDSIGRGGRLSLGPVVTPTAEGSQLPTILVENEDECFKKELDNKMAGLNEKDDVLDLSPSAVETTTDNDGDETDEKAGILSRESDDPEAGKARTPIYKPGVRLSHSALDRVKLEINSSPGTMNGSVPNGMPTYVEAKQGVKLGANGLLSPEDFASRIQSQSTQVIPITKTRKRKCPPGVHREDYSRPMYRKDIFYSGSIIHIPEFQSTPSVQMYMKSVTSIPRSAPFEEETGLWQCSCIPKSAMDTLKQMMDFSLFKDPIFLIACLGNLCGSVGLFIPYIYIAEKARSLGIESTDAAFLLSVIGITNTVGRVLAGLLADCKWVNTLALHNSSLIVGGLACILNMFCTTYASLCIFAAVFGMCVATWISLTSIILCDLLGLQKLTNAFGLLTMARGFASIGGAPVAGMIYEATSDFNASFHVGGSMLVVAGLLFFTLHLPFFQQRSFTNLQQDAFDLNLPLPDDSSDDGNDADVEDGMEGPSDQLSPV